MAKASFDIPTQLPASVTRPLHAGVDATDRVVEVVREAVADVQKRAVAVQKDVQKRAVAMQKDVQETVSGLDYRPEALRTQASHAVAGLQADAKQLPARLQKLVDGQVATASAAFGELTKRGEILIGRVLGESPAPEAPTAPTGSTAAAKATTTSNGTKAPKKTVKSTKAKTTAKTGQATTKAKPTTKAKASKTAASAAVAQPEPEAPSSAASPTAD